MVNKMDIFNRFNSWKVLRYSDKLQQIADMENIALSEEHKYFPHPLVWHVYPSNKCNMDCTFCIMKEEKKKYPFSLSKDVLLKVVNDANRTGAHLIHFSGGGEPFLNPYTETAIRYNSEFDNPVKIAVSTNGVFLKPEITKYVNHVRVSLNASNETTHMNIMRSKKGDFKKILDNIKDVIRLRNYDGDYHDVGMAFLITPSNWTEAYSFAEIAWDLGVDFVHFRPAFYPRSDSRNEEIMDIVMNKMGKIRENILKDFSNRMSVGIVTEKFEGYWSSCNYKKCRATPLQCVLTASGEFVVCQDVFIRFGNYNKMSFEDCWFSQDHLAAINNIKLADCPRCVETRHNQIIEHMFIHNDVRSELL